MATIRDRNVDWARKRIFRSYMDFPSWVTLGTNAATGAAAVAEVGTTGLCAAKLTATGDIVADIWPVPYDLDDTQETHIRVYWATAATPTTDDCTWVAKIGVLSNASAIAVGSTAIGGTAIAEDRSAGADKLNITSWGDISALKLSPGKLCTVHLDISATDVTIGTEFIYLIGYELEYTPQRCSHEVGQMPDEARQRDDISY